MIYLPNNQHWILMLAYLGLLLGVWSQNPPAQNDGNQQPSNNGGNAPQGANNGTNETCNPNIQNCPTADCMDSPNLGLTQIMSPNRSAYEYIGVPILVNWTYSDTTNKAQFPLTKVSIYYKPMSSKTWIFVADVGARNTTFNWTVTNVLEGSYDVKTNLIGRVS
jgi:hypothetical protein